MFNIALAIAFAIAAFLSPGVRVLTFIIDGSVLRSLSSFQQQLLLSFVSYLAPAVLAYILLRIAHAETWLRTRRAIQVMLGIANCLIIIYVVLRTAASAVQGGGPSFVVMQFAPFVIYPAFALLAIGLGWLGVRSSQLQNEEGARSPRPWSGSETLGVFVLIGVPVAVVAWTLFLSADAPFRLAREAKQIFQQRCTTAGEKIYERPQDVQSIYLDPNGGQSFDTIVNGVFRVREGGILGEPLVNGGFLLYFEKRNDRQRMDGSTAKYRRLVANDWKGEPVDELTSDYGVFQKSLVTAEESRLGLSGTEVIIRNMRNEHVLASLVYFVSSRHRAICGHSDSGRLNVSEFITRSLNLTRRYPGAYPQPPSEK